MMIYIYIYMVFADVSRLPPNINGAPTRVGYTAANSPKDRENKLGAASGPT